MLKKVGSWIGTVKRYISDIQNEVTNFDDETNDMTDANFKKKTGKKDE